MWDGRDVEVRGDADGESAVDGRPDADGAAAAAEALDEPDGVWTSADLAAAA